MYLSVELENPAMPEITQVSAADFIGPRVKELCDKQQITKYRLSQMTGVTQTVLSRIIKRENVPTIQTLEKICAAFDISLSQLFAGKGEAVELTENQRLLLERWAALDNNQRQAVLKLMETMAGDI